MVVDQIRVMELGYILQLDVKNSDYNLLGSQVYYFVDFYLFKYPLWLWNSRKITREYHKRMSFLQVALSCQKTGSTYKQTCPPNMETL